MPKKYTPNKELLDLQKQAIEKYFRLVIHTKDDISFILTTHLYIEYWMEQFIRYTLPKPEKILDTVNLTFLEKLALARSLGFDRDEEFGLAEATKKLNTLRNKIVHSLEYKIKKEDVKLLSILKYELGKDEKRMLERLESPREELFAFCFTFHGYIVGFIEGKIGRKKTIKND